MALRSIEHYRLPDVRKFLDDMNSVRRLDLLLIKGGVFLQDLLVGLAAARSATTEDAMRKLPFAKLARRALDRQDEAALLKFVLSFAHVRNRIAHDMITNEFVPDFVEPISW